MFGSLNLHLQISDEGMNSPFKTQKNKRVIHDLGFDVKYFDQLLSSNLSIYNSISSQLVQWSFN